MDKKEKETVVSFLKEKIENSSAVYLTDFSGLTVEQTNDLRTEFYNARLDYKVAKNTFIKRALTDSPTHKFQNSLDKLIENLKGPTGVIFAYDDPVSPAKIIKKFFEKNEKPKLKIAVIENVIYDSLKLNELASLPSKNEIISSIIGSLHSPISGIVNSLNAVLRDLSCVIEEVAKKKNINN